MGAHASASDRAAPASALTAALDALRNGTPIVILDDPRREGEADLVLHARFCTPQNLALLRERAGGLICLGMDAKTAQALRLPYSADLLRASDSPTLRALALVHAPYGDPSAFSIWINHKETYTGITDRDRSLTITKFEAMVSGEKERMEADFTAQFYSPGHVPLLIARPLSQRRGHTELCLSLAQLAGMSPAMVMCEMLDGESGRARDWNSVQALAREMGWPAVQGRQIVEAMADSV